MRYFSGIYILHLFQNFWIGQIFYEKDCTVLVSIFSTKTVRYFWSIPWVYSCVCVFHRCSLHLFFWGNSFDVSRINKMMLVRWRMVTKSRKSGKKSLYLFPVIQSTAILYRIYTNWTTMVPRVHVCVRLTTACVV